MSRLSDLFTSISHVKKRKKDRYRAYNSEVLALKMEQVERPNDQPKKKGQR